MRSLTVFAVLSACSAVGANKITSSEGNFALTMSYGAGINEDLIGKFAMFHVQIVHPTTEAVVFDIYKYINVEWPAVLSGEPEPKVVVSYPGRYAGDYKVKVDITSAVPVVSSPPSTVSGTKLVAYNKNGVQLSDTTKDWKICMNPLDATDACSQEVTLARAFTTDTTEMELKDWADPPCFTKVYEGGCMKGENFMLFEYTPETSQFVTMLKMSGLIPRVRKNPNGAVIAVDQWSVSIDVVPGTAADLVTAMGLPAAGSNTIGPIGGNTGDETCRTYEQADAHGATKGFRHSYEHTSNNQFILASAFRAVKDTKYTIRVKLDRGVTAPACTDDTPNDVTDDKYAIGILGRDAGTCKQQCVLHGMPMVGDVASDCILGCMGAHPTLVTDPSLCAELVCCGKGLCGSQSDWATKNVNCNKGSSSKAEAQIGCGYAADPNNAGNAGWLKGKLEKCDAWTELEPLIDHDVDTGTGTHGLGFFPDLEDGLLLPAGSKLGVSCIGEKPLLADSCDSYTCDRGTYVGSQNGNYEGCQFQTHCVQGCLRTDLELLHPNHLMGQMDDVVEPDADNTYKIFCDPNPQGSIEVDGKYEGFATFKCSLDTDNQKYIWGQVTEGDGVGSLDCKYVPAAISTEKPITLASDDLYDVDAAGNIVLRTSTVTSTTVTTEDVAPKVTTTSTTAVVSRPALSLTWLDVDLTAVDTNKLYEFRMKTEDVIVANTELERNEVLFFTYESDGINSTVFFHFKEAEVTEAEVTVASDKLNTYLGTTAVQLRTSATDARTPSMSGTSATTSMYSDNINDLRTVDPLMVAAASSDADGLADYSEDETDDTDVEVQKSKLKGSEKFGLAVLIMLIIAMVGAIAYMAHKMQTHPKYKKQTSGPEGQAAIPMMELDPFNQASGAAGANSAFANKPRSIHAMRRQTQNAAQQYAGNGGPGKQFLRSTSGGAFSPGGSSVETSFDRAPTTRTTSIAGAPRNMSGFNTSPQPGGVARGNQRQTVQLRPQPPRQQSRPTRSITEDAELGLEALEPAVFGTSNAQQSVRARPQSGIAGTAQVGFTSADQLAIDATISEGGGETEEVFL